MKAFPVGKSTLHIILSMIQRICNRRNRQLHVTGRTAKQIKVYFDEFPIRGNHVIVNKLVLNQCVVVYSIFM